MQLNFLSKPDINVNLMSYHRLTPFIQACSSFASMKILKMLSSSKNFKLIDSSAFETSVLNGNFYAVKFFIENISQFLPIKTNFYIYFLISLKNKNFYLLKIILTFYLERFGNEKYELIESTIKNNFSNNEYYKKDLFNDFKQVYNEINRDFSINECIKFS